MKYRSKPTIKEAIQWTGDNFHHIAEFCGLNKINITADMQTIVIPTLEGSMGASIGDYIIRGIKGEFYPCKPDVFNLTYEEIKE